MAWSTSLLFNNRKLSIKGNTFRLFYFIFVEISVESAKIAQLVVQWRTKSVVVDLNSSRSIFQFSQIISIDFTNPIPSQNIVYYQCSKTFLCACDHISLMKTSLQSVLQNLNG